MTGAIRFGGLARARSGESKPADVFQRFAHYVGQVWVNDHDPPTGGAALAQFDPLSIKRDYEQFLARGGHVDYQRGLTLEEGVLGRQLFMREEYICAIATEVNPGDLPRIRKVMMPASAVCELLAEVLAAMRKARGVACHVYRGASGHTITCVDHDPSSSTFTYFDSWPDRSLLAEWADTVRPDPGPERLWRIDADALTPILYAIQVPLPLWRELHGEAHDEPRGEKRRPKPSELSDDQRQAVLDFFLLCVNAGLLTAQGQQDFQALAESGTLWDTDRDGVTVFEHLQRMVAVQKGDVRPMLNKLLRHLADPTSVHQ
jgi:hypothetical protein